MATSQPPSYEEALAQMKKIQAEGIPDEAKKKAEEAMTQKMAEPETKQQIVDEVNALADSAIKIDQAFQRVSVGLGQVDDKKFTSPSGGELPKLRPTWDGFHSRYTKILWASRRTARETEVYLQDFIDVVLPGVQDAVDDPDNEKKLKGAKADLEEFIKRTNPNQGIVEGSDAEGHSQEFTKLSRDIKEFKGTFDKFTEAQGVEVNAAITKLKGEIDVLQLEVTKVDTIITGMGIALGVTAFGTIVGATAALAATGPLAPLALVAVLVGLFLATKVVSAKASHARQIIGIGAAIGELTTLIIYLKQRNELQGEIEEKKSAIKKLQGDLELLQSIQAGLQANEKDMDDIIGRLDKFAHIWAMIAHDAGAIRDMLNNMEGSATSGALGRRLKLLQNVYNPLIETLRLYATSIDQSGVPKPSE